VNPVIASNRYRSHTCAVLRPEHIGQPAKLAGWVHRKRDHGSLLFIDLRDHYGITQCVFTPNSAAFAAAESVRLESVISVTGNVIERTAENVNPALPTGGVEVKVDGLEVLSTAELLPFQVAGTQDIPEEQRLRYRFLDLRREKIHANIILRSKVIASIRRRMQERPGRSAVEASVDGVDDVVEPVAAASRAAAPRVGPTRAATNIPPRPRKKGKRR